MRIMAEGHPLEKHAAFHADPMTKGEDRSVGNSAFPKFLEYLLLSGCRCDVMLLVTRVHRFAKTMTSRISNGQVIKFRGIVSGAKHRSLGSKLLNVQ
jgi:hypothetical protein